VIPGEKNRVFGLDVMRATAILLVLAAHTWPAKSGGHWAGAMAVLGVELFFVLSGFLIGGILLRLDEQYGMANWSTIMAFWSRRWFRTLPNYYLFLGLHLIWRAWVLGFPNVLETNWKYLVFAQNILYPPSLFFPETWSLAIEEWFYLLLPIFLALVVPHIAHRRAGWGIVLAGFIVIPALMRLWHGSVDDPYRSQLPLDVLRAEWHDDPRKLVVPRLDMPMYGVLASFVAHFYQLLWKRLVLAALFGVVLVSCCVTSLAFNVPLDIASATGGFLFWPLLGIGISLLLPFLSRPGSPMNPVRSLVTFIAKVSYALYLSHGLVLLVLNRYCGPKSVLFLPANTPVWSIVALGLAFGVATVTYRFFEKPIMDLRDRLRVPAASPGKKVAVETH
jgi:peptidoglycan/LPS O-acetylase OafA/YrhL